jgi:hypothetical protein
VVYERTENDAGSLENGKNLGDKESNLVVGDQQNIESKGLSVDQPKTMAHKFVRRALLNSECD